MRYLLRNYAAGRAFATTQTAREVAVRMSIVLVCAALSWAPLLHAAAAGTETQVTFSDYSPLSSNAEMARRLLSPLAAARLPQLLQRSAAP